MVNKRGQNGGRRQEKERKRRVCHGGQREKHGGQEGTLGKACLLPGSRRQRQKNLGDRDVLTPWGERRESGGKRLEGGGQEYEFEEWVGQSQDVW